VRLGVTPEINALASIMIALVAVSVSAVAFAMRRRIVRGG
jgi:ABC-type spermidine/putrescine transport system permease subunit II